MAEYMLETSAIGMLEEWDIDPDLLKESEADFFTTHIQEDELKAIPNEDFREKMLSIFEVVSDDDVATESAIVGVSKVGRAKLGGGSTMGKIRDELSDDEGNETRDALMAETAIHNGFTFVTHDQELLNIIEEHYPHHAISMKNFCEKIGADWPDV